MTCDQSVVHSMDHDAAFLNDDNNYDKFRLIKNLVLFQHLVESVIRQFLYISFLRYEKLNLLLDFSFMNCGFS